MKICKLILALACTSLIIACKKETALPKLASINVVNVAINSTAAKINYFGKSISWSKYIGSEGLVSYGANRVVGVVNPTEKYFFAVSKASDSTEFLFNDNVNLENNAIYSLYLTGQSPNYQSVLIKEALRYYPDSVLAIRIINLSPNSEPINVTINGSQSINEFSNIAFKQQSGFREYIANYKTPTTYFLFQIRSSNGTMLASYSLTAAQIIGTRNRAATLVFRGLIGATGANGPAISFVPNY